jgi:hypothetical protein
MTAGKSYAQALADGMKGNLPHLNGNVTEVLQLLIAERVVGRNNLDPVGTQALKNLKDFVSKSAANGHGDIQAAYNHLQEQAAKQAQSILENVSRSNLPADIGDIIANRASKVIDAVVRSGDLFKPIATAIVREGAERAAAKIPVAGWAVAGGTIATTVGTSSQAAEAGGATRREAQEVGAMRGAMETISAFDPTIIGSMSADAIKNLSLQYRQGLTNSTIAKIADGALSRSGNGLYSLSAVSTGLAVAGLALEKMNDRELTITVNGIDRRQEALFDKGEFPQTLRLNNQDVPIHVALRDPRAFNGMHGYYSSNNTNGQFNDEIRALNQFAQLERQRDTIIDRAEARGDLNARTADQLQNGSHQNGIRTGMTFSPS